MLGRGSKLAAVKISAIIVTAIVVVVAVAGVALYILTAPAPTPTPTPTRPKITEIRIGMIEPLTGKYAVFGKEAVDAARLIIEIINEELGGVKSLGGVKLVLVGVEDAGESPEVTAMAAERLIATHRPHIIVGAYISRLTAAAAEVTERERVIFAFDALVDWLTERGWRYVIRLAPKASAHGATAARFALSLAKERGVEAKKVVVLHEDSVFGTYVATGAIRELAANRIPYESVSYPYTIEDFGPIISRLREIKPDIIISVPYFHDGVLFAKAYRASGLKVKLIAGAGGCGYIDPGSIEAVGEAVEYFTNTLSYDPSRATEWNKKVVEKYVSRYGKPPSEAAGIIFYTLFFIYEGLEKASEMFPDDPLNPDNLMKVFMSLDLTDENSISAQLYPTGRIKLAPNGDNIYAGTAVLQVIGGKARVVWPKPEPGVVPVCPMP